ncbi:hypothetical protein, partial [Gelidibacter japonicus]|uniref:hypothetical protein n=1 Tax=Gelidibacter japonicus TaxID=1962232 RepID=UPI003A91C6B6
MKFFVSFYYALSFILPATRYSGINHFRFDSYSGINHFKFDSYSGINHFKFDSYSGINHQNGFIFAL